MGGSRIRVPPGKIRLRYYPSYWDRILNHQMMANEAKDGSEHLLWIKATELVSVVFVGRRQMLCR